MRRELQYWHLNVCVDIVRAHAIYIHVDHALWRNTTRAREHGWTDDGKEGNEFLRRSRRRSDILFSEVQQSVVSPVPTGKMLRVRPKFFLVTRSLQNVKLSKY